MRVFAVLLLVGVASAAAKSLSAQDLTRELALRELLNKLGRVEKGVTPPVPTAGSDDDEGCNTPCSDVPVINSDGEEDMEEFWKCVIDTVKGIVERFNQIFREQTGKNLFEEHEREIIWHLRTDWVISRQMKEILEVIVEEIAEGRFRKELEDKWDDLDESVKDTIEDLHCQYGKVRELAYSRMDKK